MLIRQTTMKKLTLLVFTFAIIIGCNHATNSETDATLSIIQEFESQLKKDIKDDNIKGSISAAIVKNNKIIWSKAFGIADIERNIPADTNTIYRTASISKTFTAFLMMQLYQKGIIGLDDPIEKYFPEIKRLKGYSDATKITFRQLASHTSGLQREPSLKNAAKGHIEEWENKILVSIPATSFQFKPGEEHNYSNIGFGILGLALSRAANIPYMELIENEILKPLNMKNSFFIVPDTLFQNLAKGNAGGPLGASNYELPDKEHKGRGYKVPNGGIYATPNDLAKFMICNMGYSDLLT